MRTTIKLDDDVAAAVEQLRRERGLGVSAAVNELARKGLQQPKRRTHFEQESSAMRARIDVSNIGEALEVLEGPAAR